jgi:hypothetical protein
MPKSRMIIHGLIASVACMLLISASHSAQSSVIYTYKTALSNPLLGLLPASSGPDYITIGFTSPSFLLPNAVYDISADDTADFTSSWSASDSLFGIKLVGVGAPFALVPAPGLLPGGALLYCDQHPGVACFGGAVATNTRGQIAQWNLVADGAGSQYLTFISYNDTYLGSMDALGSVQDGHDELELNKLNGATGVWASAVPEPAAWSIMLMGLLCFGSRLRLLRKRLPRGRDRDLKYRRRFPRTR